MKFALPFLLITAVVLTACDTLATRRSLYAPEKASGPYTEAVKTGSWRRGHYPEHKKSSTAAPASTPAEQPPTP